MLFECEKVLLQNAINLTGRAVSPKSSIPALEGLLLQAETGITLSGYNMNTGIRSSVPANVQERGRVVLSARLFGDIVRRMPDDMIRVTVNDNLLVRLTCRDADFEISGLDAADFPELPNVEEESSLTIRQNLFRDMIDQTVFSVSTNEARPVHTGALFETDAEKLTIVAVDGFRLALRRDELLSAAGNAMSFIVPGSALNEVKNICADTDEPAAITVGKRHILFEIGETELICRRLEGEFLNYRTAIPRDNPTRVNVECRDLLNSLDRVSVVISEKLKAPVRCRFERDRVFLSARTGSGEARDVCPIAGDGGNLEIGFNNRYLIDALRHAPADTVEIQLNTGVSPAIIVPADGQDQFLYMVLPVRLKA
ncbi:MAG: DNA polymerase III subunit beta [Oscillibacter sp.]|nr:DNA polymerase III subunit beta [Oscillibacter sp.]